MSGEANTLPRHPAADEGLLKRLWIYQEDRFPIFKTAILLAVFSAASISVSAHLADRSLPGIWVFVAVWLVALIIFFQMRACDEFKDLEDDRTYRPERPIPSGLVSLSLILKLAAFGAVLAIALTASIYLWLLVPLLGVWLWLALMTHEFFVADWLKARWGLYLVSHMAIMPLIDLYITAAEWLPHSNGPPAGLWLFLALSFANGCVLELGRKTWSPESERPGVETYSALLGPTRAVWLWVAVCAVAWLLLAGVGLAVRAPLSVAGPGLIMLLVVVFFAQRFSQYPTVKGQKGIDTLAGLWVFACYCLAGFAPFIATGFQ
ncbi:MAG: UbiA family prenyltransferase [Pseudomonadota bacterium]